jgi:hypothetical protein
MYISHHIEYLIPSVVTGIYLFSGLLPSNNSFAPIRCSGNVITEPLLSNGRSLRLHYSGFQPSCHNIFNCICLSIFIGIANVLKLDIYSASAMTILSYYGNIDIQK